MKEKIKKALREVYGHEFNTVLEHQYAERIIKRLEEGSMSEKKEWATYNQVLLELKHNIKDALRVRELQYKITEENINPQEVCIDIIESIVAPSPELERLYNKIKNFYDKD